MSFVDLLLTTALVALLVQVARDRQRVRDLELRLDALVMGGAPVGHAPQPAAAAAAAAAATAPPAPPSTLPPDPPWKKRAQAAPTEPAAAPAPLITPSFAPVPSGPSRFERLFAEHAMALVGGAFVLVAAVMFVSFAIDQGWIGDRTRFVLATGFGIALIATGWRMAAQMAPAERVGRAIGSVHGVLAATGIGVVFLAIVAAVRLQEVLDPTAGVALEVIAAAVAVAIARAWRSQDLAAFGMGVALAAPILVGASASTPTLALLSVALLGAIALAIIEQWPRLLLVAALITGPQVASYVDLTSTASSGLIGPPVAAALTVIAAWWLALVVGCVLATLRSRSGPSRSIVSTVFVVTPAAMGLIVLTTEGRTGSAVSGEAARDVSLVVLAAACALLATALLRRWRERAEALAVALLGVGAVAAATALSGAAPSGELVVAGWAAEAVALGVLWWRIRSRLAAAFALAFAAAAVLHALFVDLVPVRLFDPAPSFIEPFAAALSIAIAACFARWLSARLDADSVPGSTTFTERALDVVAAVSAWLAGGVAIVAMLARDTISETLPDDDAMLGLAAWALVAALLAVRWAVRTERAEVVGLAVTAWLMQPLLLAADGTPDERRIVIYAAGAIAAVAGSIIAARTQRDRGAGWLLLAAGQTALVVFAALWRVPPQHLWAYDAGDGQAVVHLAMLVVSTAALAIGVHRHPTPSFDARRMATSVSALSAWYFVSIVVVALMTDVHGEVEQDAQLTLTLVWVALGVGTLIASATPRLRRHTALRLGAYALLGIAALKLVISDTATLDTPMRVLAFLMTGLALLGSAALEQRMRAAEDER